MPTLSYGFSASSVCLFLMSVGSMQSSGLAPLTVLCRRPLRSQSLLAISLLPVIRQSVENTTHFSSFFRKTISKDHLSSRDAFV